MPCARRHGRASQARFCCGWARAIQAGDERSRPAQIVRSARLDTDSHSTIAPIPAFLPPATPNTPAMDNNDKNQLAQIIGGVVTVVVVLFVIGMRTTWFDTKTNQPQYQYRYQQPTYYVQPAY